jgi:hypothetical protein
VIRRMKTVNYNSFQFKKFQNVENNVKIQGLKEDDLEIVSYVVPLLQTA